MSFQIKRLTDTNLDMSVKFWHIRENDSKSFGKGKQYQENGSRIRIALYFSTATQLINDKKRKGKDGCKGGPNKILQ